MIHTLRVVVVCDHDRYMADNDDIDDEDGWLFVIYDWFLMMIMLMMSEWWNANEFY